MSLCEIILPISEEHKLFCAVNKRPEMTPDFIADPETSFTHKQRIFSQENTNITSWAETTVDLYSKDSDQIINAGDQSGVASSSEFRRQV